ncbi:MAG: MFS transporter [Leucobacter sp.]
MNWFDWRWIFIFMLPIAIAVLIIGIIALRLPGQRRDVRLDITSVTLSALGFGGIVYALASASALLRGDFTTIIVGVIGIIGLGLFILRQKLRENMGALLDLRPFSVAAFRRAVVLVGLAFTTMLGSVIVLPLYFQDGLGLTVLETGLLLLGGGLTQAIFAPVFGRLYDRIGARPIVIPGAIIMLVGQIALATIGATTLVGLVVAYYVLFSVGLAAILSSMMTASLASLNPRLFGLFGIKSVEGV